MDAMEIRRNAIVELVNKYGTVSFSQIKEQFSNVSEMTLRTDLKALDEAKEIVRIHGGAKSVQLVIGTDDYLTRRAVRNIQAKQQIARKALQLSAIRELEQVNFHQTFLGVTGYSMKAGFTCGNNEEAMLKRTAIEQAEQVVVLMDASKTDIKSTYTICGLADVDIIISDGNLPKEFLLACETHHITVY